jgi:hypothetical protein
VPRLWNALALVLLVLWLPATSHCALERLTAGDTHTCGASCSHDHDGAGTGECALVEGGDYLPGAASTATVPPTSVLLAALAPRAPSGQCSAARAPSPSPPGGDAAPERVWAFAHRLVPPSRAP